MFKVSPISVANPDVPVVVRVIADCFSLKAVQSVELKDLLQHIGLR